MVVYSLNHNKCTILHLGNNNPKYRYNILNLAIPEGEEQNDLDIIVFTDLKWSKYISYIVKKAN